MGCLNGKPAKQETMRDPLLQKHKGPGQLLDIVDKTQKGYWMGQVDGQTVFGWFPSACVVLIDEKEAIFEMEKQRIAEENRRKHELSREVTSGGQRRSMTVNASGKVLRARALTSYSSSNPSSTSTTTPPPPQDGNSTSISFSKGDAIVITDRSRPDWWLGHIEGQTGWGWFPAKSVEITP